MAFGKGVFKSIMYSINIANKPRIVLSLVIIGFMMTTTLLLTRDVVSELDK